MDRMKRKKKAQPLQFQPREFDPLQKMDADMVFLQDESEFVEISLEDEEKVSTEEEWGTKNASIRQAVQKESTRNKSLWQRFQGLFSRKSAKVSRTVDVPEPPVQQPAVQESRKQLRERLKKQKRAVELCPVGDVDTIDFSTAIRTKNKMIENSAGLVSNFKQKADEQGFDDRMVYPYLRGHRKNIFGRPATQKDREAARRDKAMLEAFANKDMRAIEHYLDMIVEDIISMDFRYDTLTPENITKNFEKYLDMTRKMNTLDNLESHFPEYFGRLDQFRKDMLAANKVIGAVFTEYLKKYSMSRGVDFHSGDIFGYKEIDSIRSGMDNIKAWLEMFQNEAISFQRNIGQIIARQRTSENQ
jgi:hypothetical protein